MEVLTDFHFLGGTITPMVITTMKSKDDCFFPACHSRKAMTNLDSMLKSGDVTLPTNVCIVKAAVFLVVIYGCESWNTKLGESHRIVAFELWCW